ncbi:MAG: transposase [Blastocatellales bacterium]|nr:transposase [Blastocatellales bacterium]
MSGIFSLRNCVPVTLSFGITSRPIKLRVLLLLIEAAGARVEPLPAYSPEFNPKEECISKIKSELKRVKANTTRKLKNALRRAYAKVTLTDIRGWFQHCGYSVP